jgi:hypothetical protein
LLRHFIPELAETLMYDLDVWEEHRKFVLRRDVASSRLPSEAGYVVSGRQPRVTPASHSVSLAKAAARELGAHVPPRSASTRSWAHEVVGAFSPELTKGGPISAVSPFDPAAGTIEIDFDPDFQLCMIRRGAHGPDDGAAISFRFRLGQGLVVQLCSTAQWTGR